MTKLTAIDEIKYYCNQSTPTGALLLSGKWGSGKTYLFSNILVNDNILKDTHVFIRLSLFGIDSIESINRAVKKKWVNSCSPLFKPISKKDAGNIIRTIDKASNILGIVFPRVKGFKDSVLSIDFTEWVSISPVTEINGIKKKVVLVFDDLERSKLQTADILGCINEYCENMGFFVIIIANEELLMYGGTGSKQILNEKDLYTDRGLSYLELKEKVISRTVHYIPDFDSVINSIISSFCSKREENDKYCEFIKNHVGVIKSVFALANIYYENQANFNYTADEEQIKKYLSTNLRSLKCAIVDFERLYKHMSTVELKNIDRYLYSFIVLEMISRNNDTLKETFGVINDNEENAIRKVYPEFSLQYVIPHSFQWLVLGIWKEAAIIDEIKKAKELTEIKEEKDILKEARWIDVDDDLLKTGFDGLISDCYKGAMNLHEYYYFIKNAQMFEKYKIKLPSEIEWDKVTRGVEKRIKQDIEMYSENDNSEKYRIFMDTEYLYSLTGPKRNIYKMIYDYYTKNIAKYENNKKRYLEAMHKGTIIEYVKSDSRSLNVFTDEMVSATIKYFDSCSQADKLKFPEYFRSIWAGGFDKNEVDKKEIAIGFNSLKEKLEVLEKKYIRNDMQLALFSLREFINVVDEIGGGILKNK